MRKLSLGSGSARQIADAVTVDVRPETGADVVHDLDVYPWPFRHDEFDEIYCYDILEHLHDVVAALAEIHRIGKAGARVLVTAPHFSCRNAFTDPTHRHFFGLRSFDYFCVNGAEDVRRLSYYSRARFEKVKAVAVFEHNLVNKIVRRFAARWPDVWERRLAWVFPAWFMEIQLSVIK